MQVILDWDYTLFDTKKFKNDLAKSLLSVGLPKQQFFDTYHQTIQQGNGKYNYNYYKHALFIGRLNQLTQKQTLTIARNFLKVINSGRFYLYKDTVDFLKFLKARKVKSILCTWGNTALQRRKIASSGMKSYFDCVSIAEANKYLVIKNLFKNTPLEPVYFVSDNLDELLAVSKSASFVQPILKIRSDKKEIVRDAVRFRVPAFSSLRQISRFLSKA